MQGKMTEYLLKIKRYIQPRRYFQLLSGGTWVELPWEISDVTKLDVLIRMIRAYLVLP